MKRVLLILAMLVGMMTIASPVAAGCNPGRANQSGSWFVEQRQGSSPTAIYEVIEADIEENDVYLESGGMVNQFIELSSPGVTTSKVRMGLSSIQGQGTRIFVQAIESTGNVGPLYYSYSDSSNVANVKIISDGKVFTFWTGSTRVQTIIFDNSWAPKRASKWVTSNNLGNQIPGRPSNANYFLDATYTTQYGTASWGGTIITPTPFPSGATFGSNSTGFWTKDNC